MPEITNVLVVADDWAQRELLRLLLEDRGYVVLEAEDGVSALEMLERLDAAGLRLIVVLDADAPGVNGFDILRAAQQEPHLCFAHAYVLVTQPQQALPCDVWPLLESLAIPVLCKPLDLDLLFETVAVLALPPEQVHGDPDLLGL